ncbi:pilus assembly protein CpaE [Sporobacter termitidis DSM 10068]|uniref:Pilus assembly protein CpaE n=1 Tax=Sporobacter termitidis DSM 10068 TaxID=1123282 RepID=A0A1M5Z432_9FIRM|nr:AAA family ATPase [Sporobacter termitidis]SHI18969.1 pilus assembly protein CpaE [Sporobacter termitidis DSM 10068]
MKIKILLLGSQQNCAQLATKLQDEDLVIVGTVTDENSVLDEINRTSPDLILISDTSPMALRSCQQIYLLRPRSVPVVISDIDDVSLMQRIMQTGVHYILNAQMEPLSLMSELKGIYNNEANRILALENATTSSSKSKVILVFGPKDGVGKSTLAVNLAVKLAQNKNKVVVLDYDFQFGDVSALLGVETKKTILELIQEQSNVNVDIIRQFLSLHISGVNFLPAPNNPEYADSISPAQAERIIAALRVYYDYVIVDCFSGFNDYTATCIDCASLILFVTKKDIPALRNAKKGLDVIQALTGWEKIRLIIGKDSDGTIRDKDVSRVLSFPIWDKIPYDDKPAVNASDQGSPLVLEYPKSKIGQAIAHIASQIDRMSFTKEDSKQKSWHLLGNKG